MVANIIQNKELAQDVEDTSFNLKLKTIGICSINKEDWLVTDLACNMINVASVALYDTLGSEMLNIILD